MTAPLLETKHLSKYYSVKGGPFGGISYLRALDGVDLSLGPGETLGLAGESGCGKSTVAKILMGLLSPSGGSVLFAGKDLSHLQRHEWKTYRKTVQMIFQDPFSSLNPRMRIGEVIGEPLAINDVASGPARRQRVLDLMHKVGLSEEHYDRYPHEFSGGQRQRVGIARALAVEPRIIIADEPVSALDLSIQAQIINLLQDLKREFALSFIFIAHDLAVVRHMSDRVAIMYLGRIVETGSRDAVFDRCRHPYTEALLSAIPQVDPHSRSKKIILAGDPPSPVTVPSGCPFHTRCPHVRPPLCTDSVPALEEKAPGHLSACHFSHDLYG